MLRRGAPVFRPASTREAGRNSHRYPSAWRSRQQGWRNAAHARNIQERRSSDRHRGHRPRNSHRYPSAWRSRQRGWRNANHARNTRSAGLQTGIAATGRETPRYPSAWRSRQRGWRNATHARNTRSAGLQTGIAAKAAKLPPLSVCMAHGHGNAALRAVLPVGPGTARRRRAAGKDPREGPPVRRWSPSRREPRREASPG